VLCFAVAAGWLIAEWWAVLVALVNGTMALVWGPSNPDDEWTQTTLVFGAVEAACLGVGVVLGLLL